MRCTIFLSLVVTVMLFVTGCGQTSDFPSADFENSPQTDRQTVGSDAAETITRRNSSASKSKDADDGPMPADKELRSEHHERKLAEKSSDLTDETQRQITAPRGKYQPGTLTAGSINDNADYSAYRDYLSSAMQSKQGIHLPQLALGRRVEIQVNDQNDRGIGNARVIIHRVNLRSNNEHNHVASGEPLLKLVTGTDGKTQFIPGIDLEEDLNTFLLTVIPPGGSHPVSKKVSFNQTPWKVTLPKTESRLPQSLDLALVIDTTGSMGDELEYLKSEIDDITAAVQTRFPNVKQRFALILYRDEGDQYVTRMFDFTGSVNEFRRNLSEQHALGGGDYPEAIHLALEQSGKLSWQDKDVARVLFLVADAPPHRRFSQRTVNAVLDLRSLGVTIFPVAASGVRDEAEFVMRAASFLTMGQYLFLTDHSGVGNPHTKPHTPRYQIEKLNQLMIRMIASELAGRWIPPHEIIAAEEINRTPPVETSIERHQLPESTFTPAQAQVGKSVCGYFGILQCLDRFTGIISWLALPALIVFLVVAERRWAA